MDPVDCCHFLESSVRHFVTHYIGIRLNLLLSNGFTNASSLPLACPQPDVDSSAYSEDCLSMVLYVPPSLTLLSSAPTLVWYDLILFFSLTRV